MLIKAIKKNKIKKTLKSFYFKKQIKIPSNILLKTFFLNNTNFLLLNSIKYFKVPFLIKVKSTQNILHIYGLKSVKLNFFYYFFLYYIKYFNKFFYKKIFLNGLGFKIFLFSKLNYVEFKLGFSHRKILLIPFNKVKLFIKKNVILLQSYNLSELGSFLKKIKNLRKPNSYKEKGFWYQYETKSFKVIKKV